MENMGKFDCENGILYIDGREIRLKDLIEIMRILENLEETKIVDVDIEDNGNGCDVTCVFANGEKQTAHCHPDDESRWSLETGISVCLGKYLTGGSSEYNRIVRHGVKVFKDKIKAETKEIEERIERARIQENKRRKRERYLKRREERRAMCAECEEREFCEDRKDIRRNENKEKKEITLMDYLSNLVEDIGTEKIGLVFI